MLVCNLKSSRVNRNHDDGLRFEIGGQLVRIAVLAVMGGTVKIGVEAPDSVDVIRGKCMADSIIKNVKRRNDSSR